MHKFSGMDIELTKGDSIQFKVTFSGRDLPEGSIALFTVKAKPKDEEPVIEKRIEISADGTALIAVSSEDSNVPARTYYWDIRVLIPLHDGENYEVRTPMEYAAFTILEVIGDV